MIKKSRFQILFVCLVVVMLCFVFSACTGITQAPEGRGTGSISLTLVQSRTLLPGYAAIASYLIKGDGPDGATLAETPLVEHNGVLTVEPLAIGAWTLTVYALDSGNYKIYEGSTSLVINLDQVTEATVILAPITGTGSLGLCITWPADTAITGVTGSVESMDTGVVTSLAFTLSGTMARCNVNDIPTGSGLLTLQCTTSGNAIAPLTEMVQILKTKSTYGIYRIVTPAITPVTAVAYFGIDSDSGAPPAGIFLPDSNGLVTALDNTGSMLRSGYIFTGWCTESDGSGINLAVGEALPITQGTVLYPVWLPEEVLTISGTELVGCDSTYSGKLIIPPHITSIGDSAFYECSSLASINIPESVTSIGVYAFRNCSSLASIDIPESVTSIGKAAFAYCTSLASIDIPECVTSIGDSAFLECSNLASITIPESVTSIGMLAFAYCTSLAEVLMNPATPPTSSRDSSLFSGTSSDLQIKVPAGSVDAYKAAPGWSDYASNIVSQ